MDDNLNDLFQEVKPNMTDEEIDSLLDKYFPKFEQSGALGNGAAGAGAGARGMLVTEMTALQRRVKDFMRQYGLTRRQFIRLVLQFMTATGVRALTDGNYNVIIAAFLAVGVIFQRLYSECEVRSNDPRLLGMETIGPRFNAGLNPPRLGIEWRRQGFYKDDPISMLKIKMDENGHAHSQQEQKRETLWEFLINRHNGQFLELVFIDNENLIGKPIGTFNSETLTWEDSGQKVTKDMVTYDGDNYKRYLECYTYKGKTSSEISVSRWVNVNRYVVNDNTQGYGLIVSRTLIKQTPSQNPEDRWPMEKRNSKFRCFRCMAMVKGSRCKNIINMDLANMGSIYCGVHAVSSNNVKCSNDWKIDQGRQCDPDEETLQTVRTFVRRRRDEQREERQRKRQESIDNLLNRVGGRRRRARSRRLEFDKNNIKF